MEERKGHHVVLGLGVSAPGAAMNGWMCAEVYVGGSFLAGIGQQVEILFQLAS